MLGSAILLQQYFSETPQPFSWVPMAATFASERNAATVIIARKTFTYGALIWALLYNKMPRQWAGLAVTALLAATEALQTYLPGRTPEITDPLIGLVMTLLLAGMTRASQKVA
jgi:hypothetical protein